MTTQVQEEESVKIGSIDFSLGISITLSIMYIGALLDNLTHSRNGDLIEGFFTPAHLVLYAGFGLTLMLFTYVVMTAVFSGTNWREAIPEGYEIGFFGALGFSLGGVFDMVWHELFGVENSIDALYSTSHMFLLVFGIAMAGAPLYAWFKRQDQLTAGSWADHYPAVLSIIFLLIQIGTFMAPYNPFRVLWIDIFPSDTIITTNLATDVTHRYAIETISSGMMIINGMFLALFFLTIFRAFQLPVGGFFVGVTLPGIAFAWINEAFLLIPVIIFWAVLVELLVQFFPVHKSVDIDLQVRNLHIIGFLLPFLLFQLIFLGVELTTGTFLSLHLFTGLPFLAGFTGFLASYFITANLK